MMMSLPPDTPINPMTTNPPNDVDPDLPDSIVDDSLGLTDDSAGLDSDPDELPSTGKVPPDVVTIDTALTNSRDPHGPCTVTFGLVHDLHETHQGVLKRTFEQCFTFPVGSETVHYPPGYDDGIVLNGPIINDPLFHLSASFTSFIPRSLYKCIGMMTCFSLAPTNTNISTSNVGSPSYARIGTFSIRASRFLTSKLVWITWMHGLIICWWVFMWRSIQARSIWNFHSVKQSKISIN